MRLRALFGTYFDFADCSLIADYPSCEFGVKVHSSKPTPIKKKSGTVPVALGYTTLPARRSGEGGGDWVTGRGRYWPGGGGRGESPLEGIASPGRKRSSMDLQCTSQRAPPKDHLKTKKREKAII